MSCISYVRSCVILKGLRYSDIDFERERYTAINYFENCAFYCQQEVDELYSDAFLGVIDGLVTVFDGECYFYSCSKCILKISSRYSICSEFRDGRHSKCLQEIYSYFHERSVKEIRAEYIFHLWNLCRTCVKSYFNFIKTEFMTCFHLNVSD